MGRSEAPLHSDPNGEESLEEPTENYLAYARRRCLVKIETMGIGARLRGSAALNLSTMSKTRVHSRNSIQTTLSVDPQKKKSKFQLDEGK